MQLYKRITGAYPPKALYDQVLATLGPRPDEQALTRCYQAWCARGYNPRSLIWLLEWYTNGDTQGSQVPGGRFQATAGPDTKAWNLPPATCNRPANIGPDTSPADFARWHEYQESIQRGDDPDETKRRLGL